MNSGTTRRSYDHRLRAIINEGVNARDLGELAIPRSTVASWISRGPVDVVTLDAEDTIALQAEVLKLRRRVRLLAAVVGLLKGLLRISGFRLDGQRLADGRYKADVLATVDRAIKTIPLTAAMRVLGISASR